MAKMFCESLCETVKNVSSVLYCLRLTLTVRGIPRNVLRLSDIKSNIDVHHKHFYERPEVFSLHY